jgi:dTDP-4-dehydrorhamnose 3,5-epimerase
MIFTETGLKGSFIIEPEKKEDERGYFARSFCQDEFFSHGLKSEVKQCNISFNINAGTLRGMHYQLAPYQEAKLIRCTQGAIYDVIIDIRPDSPTYCQWMAIELSEENMKMLYVPEGFAHGFQTLEENTGVFYQMFEFYHPESATGIRWNDPVLNIFWPEAVRMISDRDKYYPDFKL